MEEVFAELPFPDGIDNVAIGRSNETHLDPQFLSPAHTGEGAILEEPQQLGLKRTTHVTNLVQENRAAVGLLHIPPLGPMGSGEGSAFVAEEL